MSVGARTTRARTPRARSLATAGRGILPHLAAAAPAWVAARVLVVLVILFGDFLVTVLHGAPRHAFRFRELTTWDAGWYLQIATKGYAVGGRLGLRFFPLFPLLARGVIDLGVPARASTLLVSNLLALVLGAQVHHLVLRDKGDAALAERAAWMVALAPPAFVLVMGYSESLFLCAAVGFLACVRSQRWWWAVLFGVAAGLTRPVGIVLVVPAGIEALRGLRSARLAGWAGRLAAIASAPVGTAAFLAWVGLRFGDAMAPFSVQSARVLRGPTIDPLTNVWTAVRAVAVGNGGPNLVYATILLGLVLAVVCFFAFPASYGLLALAVILESLAGTNLDSTARYVFDAFPAVLALAWLARGRAWLPVLTLSTGLFFALYLVTCLGFYIP